MRKLIFTALLLAGCGGLPPPPTQWEVTGPAPADIQTIIRVAKEQAPCELPYWGGTMDFVPEVQCGNYADAWGCAWVDSDGTPRILIAPRDTVDAQRYAIIHELGHIAFDLCGFEADGQNHTEKFMAWISWTHFALLGAELGN